MADPRLRRRQQMVNSRLRCGRLVGQVGTRFAPASTWYSSTSVASVILSVRSGASPPYQVLESYSPLLKQLTRDLS